MNKKLICVGYSHLGATRKVLIDIASAHDLEPIFLIGNWIDDLPNKLIHLATELSPTEFQIKHPEKPYSVIIDQKSIHGIVTAGFGFSGPGDFFRVIAKKSFTGSFNGIPPPSEVKCPWCLKHSSKYIAKEPGLLSSACLKQIFLSHLKGTLTTPLSKALLSLARLTGRHAHIPTPPMPSRTVVHRFGQHVFESNLGNLMISIWNDWAKTNSNRTSELFSPVQDMLDDGWLISSYTGNGHPEFEIHANEKYGYAFSNSLDEWLRVV